MRQFGCTHRKGTESAKRGSSFYEKQRTDATLYELGGAMPAAQGVGGKRLEQTLYAEVIILKMFFNNGWFDHAVASPMLNSPAAIG